VANEKGKARARLLGKLAAIKLVIFFCFWQTVILSILTSQSVGGGIIHPGEHVAQPDLTFGIPALAICGEMMFFAILHTFVYGYKPYAKDSALSMQIQSQTGAMRDKYYGGPLGIKAFLDAFNPIDIIKAIGRGFRWMFVGRRTREQDISYQKNGTQGGILNEGTNMGPLSGLNTRKYQKLDDDADDMEAPLGQHGADMGRTDSHQEYSMSTFNRPAPNPYDLSAPQRPDLSRTPSPYEAYRAGRKSRSNSVGEGLGAAPRPAVDPFEPVPSRPGAPTPTPMHPSHGQVPYPMDPREQQMLSQDTGYHGGDHANPWGSNRL